MEAHKRNPAPRAAGRGLDEFGSRAASNDREIPQALASHQACFIARRFGISPELAATFAERTFHVTIQMGEAAVAARLAATFERIAYEIEADGAAPAGRASP